MVCRSLLAILASAFTFCVVPLLFYYDSQVRMRSWLLTGQVSEEVLITVDDYGMPFIEAATLPDAVFAIGVVQASFRLWQIDMTRRLASGRLSELLGMRTYDIDEFFRTLGINRVAEKNWAAFTDEERADVQKFCDGINFGVQEMWSLPLEYYLTWSSWEPYLPTDVLAQQAFVTYILSPGWSKELLREYVQQALGEQAAQILLPFELINLRTPTYIVSEQELPHELKASDSHVPRHQENSKATRGFVNSEGVKQDLESPILASNSWVISGQHTKSGKPLLANDPHLPTSLPSFWFYSDVKIKGLVHFRGAFQTGNFGCGLGRNDKIAWVVTSLKVDALDLYKEKRNPADPSQYLYDGQWLQFQTVTEVIKIKNAADVTLHVEVSRHGPLLPKGKPLAAVSPNLSRKDITEDIAICWTLHHIEDHSLTHFSKVIFATDMQTSINQVRKVRTPALSLTFASESGDIWFQGIGVVPIRSSFNSVPLDGSDSRNDWKGFVAPEEMPFVINPAKGYIVTANNNPCPPSYKHFYSLGSEYSEGRAERISELIQTHIDSGHKLTSQHMLAIQQDELDVLCRDALPKMLAFTERSSYWTEMSQWNCEMKRDQVEPHVYHMWIRLFGKALIEDELPEFAQTMVGVMWYRYAVTRMMALLPNSQADRWCDDTATPSQETCSDLLSSTFKEAVNAARGTAWGKVHSAQLKHLFSQVSYLKPFFHRTVEVGGSDVTPHATTSVVSTSFETMWGPTTRLVMDLGTSEYYWMLEGGQHGSVLSQHYDSMVASFHYGPLFKSEFNNTTPVGQQTRIWPATHSLVEL